jgi:hypothetical protein
MAGKIIPAVATSTSVAAALTCMDVFRVALHKKQPNQPVAFFRHYMDLTAACSFQAFFPSEPATTTVTTAAGSFQVRRNQLFIAARAVAHCARSGQNGNHTWRPRAR